MLDRDNRERKEKRKRRLRKAVGRGQETFFNLSILLREKLLRYRCFRETDRAVLPFIIDNYRSRNVAAVFLFSLIELITDRILVALSPPVQYVFSLA